jgi:hypothetical protein
LLYAVVEDVLGWYRSTYAENTPLLNPRMIDATDQLGWVQSWRDGLDRGDTGVEAYRQGGQVVVRSTSAQRVPLTLPSGSSVGGAAFGSAYGGLRSAWTPVGAGTSIVVTLPTGS